MSTVSPWMRGVIDTLVGAELLRGSAIPHRNRLVVILIDSAFETACRAFLQHKEKIKMGDSHRHRDNLISTMKSKLKEIDAEVWDSINFYYEEIRCDFYHQSAGKTITDTAVLDYRDTVEFVIDAAFKTKIRPLVEQQLIDAQTAELPDEAPPAAYANFHLADTRDKTIKVLMAVVAVTPKNVDDVNGYFKREGDSLRLKPDEFTTILARNSGSKKMFYFDREMRCWKLSKLGLKNWKLPVARTTMANYKITAVTIEVKPGVVLTAEVSSPAELKQLLNDLEQEGFKSAPQEHKEKKDQANTEKQSPLETPISRIETRASLAHGKLAAAKLLAFKDGSPQLLRPSAFASVSDATLCLLYAVEIGLQQSSVSYDDFKDLYDSQNIKSGSALPMLLTNLRNAGYIDKKIYTTDRTVRLTAKGATKAEEVIKGLCGSP